MAYQKFSISALLALATPAFGFATFILLADDLLAEFLAGAMVRVVS